MALYAPSESPMQQQISEFRIRGCAGARVSGDQAPRKIRCVFPSRRRVDSVAQTQFERGRTQGPSSRMSELLPETFHSHCQNACPLPRGPRRLRSNGDRWPAPHQRHGKRCRIEHVQARRGRGLWRFRRSWDALRGREESKSALSASVKFKDMPAYAGRRGNARVSMRITRQYVLPRKRRISRQLVSSRRWTRRARTWYSRRVKSSVLICAPAASSALRRR